MFFKIKNNKGFTLIELMISAAIFIFSTLALASALIGFLNMNKLNQEISIASQLVHKKVEEYKSQKLPEVNQSGFIEYSPKDIIASDNEQIKKIYENIKVRVFITPKGSELQGKLWEVSVVAYRYDNKHNKYLKPLNQNTLLIGI